MSMLTLIGMGLYSEKDLTLGGLERAKAADKVYVELYTSKWHGNLKKLEKLIGKKIELLSRRDLEEESDIILKEAEDKDLVVFVPGDPLVATTHISLVSDARKKGIDVEIIHNASIYSAIAEVGFHIYSFGATATVPFPEKTGGKLPKSVYEILKINRMNGFHTLLLLDVMVEENKYMMPNQGMKIMLKTEEKRNDEIFTEDTEIVVFARAGSDKPLIVYGKVKDLLNKDFGKPPFVIIVPGQMHFTEKEYLEQFR